MSILEFTRKYCFWPNLCAILTNIPPLSETVDSEEFDQAPPFLNVKRSSIGIKSKSAICSWTKKKEFLTSPCTKTSNDLNPPLSIVFFLLSWLLVILYLLNRSWNVNMKVCRCHTDQKPRAEVRRKTLVWEPWYLFGSELSLSLGECAHFHIPGTTAACSAAPALASSSPSSFPLVTDNTCTVTPAAAPTAELQSRSQQSNQNAKYQRGPGSFLLVIANSSLCHLQSFSAMHVTAGALFLDKLDPFPTVPSSIEIFSEYVSSQRIILVSWLTTVSKVNWFTLVWGSIVSTDNAAHGSLCLGSTFSQAAALLSHVTVSQLWPPKCPGLFLTPKMHCVLCAPTHRNYIALDIKTSCPVKGESGKYLDNENSVPLKWSNWSIIWTPYSKEMPKPILASVKTPSLWLNDSLNNNLISVGLP